MISTPINLFTGSVSLTPPPSTFIFTLSGNPAIGGKGMIGYGNLFNFTSIAGPGGTGPVPVMPEAKTGFVGTVYSTTVIMQGGSGSPTYSVISGTLPTGLSLVGSTGVISGTPTTAGTYSFTIQVKDGAGLINSQAFSIIITTSGGGTVSHTFLN